ncbi:metallophosphoesterase family protein [Acaryochloris marina]|uniref:metallophosphoesterase family protein n=1 Tax=Acaryochloris marina TaxID=155978 RepID=UPI0021C326CE|nr:metallophosphoesterase [Acaryochloris marina]BDM83439.1 metallophosphoesterase [Acaryochloris marina MBIC10699]
MKRRKFLYLGGLSVGLGLSCSNKAVNPKAIEDQTRAEESPSISGESSNLDTSTAPTGFDAPQKGDVRLFVISDLNSQYGAVTYRSGVEQAIQLIPDWDPDIVICAGDMVAGQSLSLSSSQVAAMWQGFDQKIFNPIRSFGLPYAFTIGNHDASSFKGLDGKYMYETDRIETNKYWSDKNPGLDFVDRYKFPFSYSFTHKDIYYLTWDASSATVSNEDWTWAAQNLASEVAQSAKMRIVVGHLPLYAVSQGRDRPGEILSKADQLRSLLEQNSVHTYICGHHHVYYPGKAGKIEMLHCGALGSGPRSWLDSVKPPIHTLTIVDVDLASQTTQYTTYDMGTKKTISLAQVPRLLVGPNGREIRRDLTLEDLTPKELDQKHIKSH